MAGIFHCRNNALIKGDVGVVGLTDSPSPLILCIVAGPEVATYIQGDRGVP